MFSCTHSELNSLLTPGLLPEGLRVLRFNYKCNTPLQPGSLTSTLTFLYLGEGLTHAIAPGVCVLPASLLRLSMTLRDHQTRVPGSLPASLESLHLDNLSDPLDLRVLPQGLKALYLGGHKQVLQPHTLTPPLLCLSFGYHYGGILHPLVCPALFPPPSSTSILDSFTTSYCLPVCCRSLCAG